MRRLVILALLSGCSAGASPAEPRGSEPDGSPLARAATAEVALSIDMAEAAGRFLSVLTPAQRARAVFPFGAGERTGWHYIPRARRGISLGELDDPQRALAFAFLSTALGRRGFFKATAIMALEEVLRQRGSSAFARDPGAYFLSVFGEPSTSASWGWRFEGHHLSLNLTLVGGVEPVAGPTFLGAAPSQVGKGYLGHARVLGREEDLGLRLVTSFDREQRRLAIVRATTPGDILTGPGAELADLSGLVAGAMSPGQQEMLAAIVDEALANLPTEVAARERERIRARGGELVFSWAGATSLGEPHYFRVSGPTFLYELDNTQEDASHLHTVWHAREPAAGDFGLDLLRQHHRDQPHPERAGERPIRSEWARPVEPFRVAGNLYYVGGANIASWLIASSRGLILIDTGPREMAPVVRAGVVKLGFRIEDIEILLVSHAHWDHVEGLAAMKAVTGARLMALAEEVPALSTGRDLSALGGAGWDPVAVDRVLHDGDQVVLGEVTLRALWTPGHTQGCTTWIFAVEENGERYQVAIVGSPAANAGVALLGNRRHPSIARDLARTHRVLKALKPDIYLTGHPEDIFAGKLHRLRDQGARALVDPAGFAAHIAEAEADTLSRLREERRRGGLESTEGER
jgi:glyoxylase-like metal-dependent hydrolase (beta-lactamase superfamily II)